MKFNHSAHIHIRFVDIDAFGHVNNANYLTYIEEARVAYFDSVVDWGYDWRTVGIILAKAEINYILPVCFKDEIHVRTRCSRIGRKSMQLEYRIVKMDSGKEILMADASTVLVAYDYQNKQSVEIPSAWKSALAAFENNPILNG